MSKDDKAAPGHGNWALAAMILPLALSAGKYSCISVLAVGAVCACVCVSVSKLSEPNMRWSRGVSVLEWAGAAGTAAYFSAGIGMAWKDELPFGIMPIGILLLAAWMAGAGEDRGARAAGVLMRLTAILIAGILCIGIRDIRPERIRREVAVNAIELVPVFLLPAAAVLLKGRRKGNSIGKGMLAAVMGAILSVWITGILSGKEAEAANNPFLEAAKAVTVFGTPQRLEPMVSAALTIGGFMLLGMLLTIAGEMGENLGIGRKKAAYAAAIPAIATSAFGYRIDPTAAAAGSFILWAIVPTVSTAMKKIKNKNWKISA